MSVRRALLTHGTVAAAAFAGGISLGMSGGPVYTAGDATITRWIDGDTVETSAGTVRLIGINTPEPSEAGGDEATAAAEAIAPIGTVVELPNPDDVDDIDRWGRDLRYVEVDGTDVGLTLIEAGHAEARYDSQDGYDPHPREADYRASQPIEK